MVLECVDHEDVLSAEYDPNVGDILFSDGSQNIEPGTNNKKFFS